MRRGNPPRPDLSLPARQKSRQGHAVAQIEKPRVRMKPFQGRVLVVAVNRDMGDALVFEELDEIDGKETFADAAFAIRMRISLFIGSWVEFAT